MCKSTGIVHTPSGWPQGREMIWRGSPSTEYRAIRAAKNSWFQEKAEETERECFGGKEVWKCIRDMQRGHRGLLPSRSVVIHSKNGELCSSSASPHQRWRRHFHHCSECLEPV